LISSPQRSCYWWERAALLLPFLVLWACYAVVLQAPLLGTDSAQWVAMAADARAEGPLQLLLQRHFVGYRPLTALSFCIATEPSTLPWIHGFDLLLITLAMVALLQLCRRVLVLGAIPTSAALLAVALHPVVAEVLPYPARRGDLLVGWALVGYFGALLQPPALGRRLFWLTVALASKEAGFVLPAVAFGFHCFQFASPTGRPAILQRCVGALRALLPELVLTLVALGTRLALLRGVGGYPDSIPGTRPGWIFLDYASGVFLPHVRGLVAAGAAGVAVMVLALGALLWLLAQRRSAVTTLALCYWLVEVVLYTTTGFFKHRLLWPSCLVLGLWLAGHFSRPGGSRRAAATLSLVWVALHLWTAPWQIIAHNSQRIEQAVDAWLNQESDLADDVVRVFTCDLPHVRPRTHWEQRLAWSRPPEALLTDREPILSNFARLLQFSRGSESSMTRDQPQILSLGRVLLDSLQASVDLVAEFDPQVPTRWRVHYQLQDAEFHFGLLLPGVPPLPSQREAGFEVYSLKSLRPKKGAAALFFAHREGDPFVPLPEQLAVKVTSTKP
jgi:hypothetical protein